MVLPIAPTSWLSICTNKLVIVFDDVFDHIGVQRCSQFAFTSVFGEQWKRKWISTKMTSNFIWTCVTFPIPTIIRFGMRNPPTTSNMRRKRTKINSLDYLKRKNKWKGFWGIFWVIFFLFFLFFFSQNFSFFLEFEFKFKKNYPSITDLAV